MSLAATLKESTAEAHKKAESTDLQRLMAQGQLPEEQYVGYMAQLFHMHLAIEELMAANPGAAALIRWTSDQEHSKRIAADLADLGTSVEAQPTCKATVAMVETIKSMAAEDAIALVGLFYVLEGSMNGNRFIVRAMRHVPGGDRCGYRYLDPYGEEQPMKWGAFREAMDSFETTEAQTDLIVRSAHAVFDGIGVICEEITAGASVSNA